MKNTIHPTYYDDARVICACGNTFTTGSTIQTIHVQICSNCHPFYTGQQKLVDTQGQVEKFSQKKATAEIKKQQRAKITEARAQKVQQTQSDKPSLRDLLLQARKKAAS